MKTRNRICAAIFFILGAFIFLSIPGNISSAHNDSLGPRFIPYIVSVAFMLLSIVLFVETFFGKKTASRPMAIADELRTILFIAALIVGVFLINKIGFLLGMIFITTVTMILLKVKSFKGYAIVYSVLLVVFLFFTYVMKIVLP